MTVPRISDERLAALIDGYSSDRRDAADDLALDLRDTRARIDRMHMALVTARDFITHHPAVRGEWPLLVQVIDGALSEDSPTTKGRDDG